jgi:hypothetical protein
MFGNIFCLGLCWKNIIFFGIKLVLHIHKTK